MFVTAARFLRFLFGIGTDPVPSDGFGQSVADDIRFRRNFAQCRRTAILWRKPTMEETRQIEDHPVIGRFGDLTIGIAEVAGRRWIVRERDWFGWPDPPRFVFFALEGEKIWAGADFDNWPRLWEWPQD